MLNSQNNHILYLQIKLLRDNLFLTRLRWKIKTMLFASRFTFLKKICYSILILFMIFIIAIYGFLNFGHEISKSGELNLEGLQDTVTVLNDKFGVSHIEAKNDHDMMMALGYITASDRLWQMDLLRRVGAGRLSEILGPDLLKTDILLRKIRLRSHMKERWAIFKETAPEHMLMQIEAYFKGVNQYVKTGPRPIEMKILGYTPDEFSIEDSLGVAGYMSLSFAEGFFVDTLYTDLLDELPLNEVNLIFPRADLDQNLPDVSLGSYNKTVSTDYYKTMFSVVSQLKERFGMFQGSNAWVLSENRTQSGKTILASDPHIAYASPSVFYEVHIKSPTYENYGHYIPLIPFPALGHNQDRGWGITMSNSDELDFYKETFHPTEPKVLFNNKYVYYRVVTEEIKVKGQEKSHFEEVIITPHGPVIDNTKFVEKGKPLSVKWQFLNDSNNPALSFYLLSQSKELKDLAPALSHTAAPGFNIVFTDSKGNIGWHVMGKIPVLPRPSNGRSILNGASGKDEYVRYLDIMENPHIYNPKSGVIVSANYKHSVDGPIPWIGLWQPKDRVLRLEALLATKEKWNTEDLKSIQTDEHVTFYKDFINDFLSEVKPETDLEKTVLEKMKLWDGGSDKKNTQSSVYYVLSHCLLKNILIDELGEERFKVYTGGADAFAFLFQVLKKKDSQLWDNILTKDKTETASEIVNHTYKESILFLTQKLGSDPDQWFWDKLNHVEFKHAMGKFFPLDKMFNLGPYPIGGGTNQVNSMGAVKGDLSFDVFYGPATRRLVDFKDVSQSFGTLPTGNSGHRSSKHYSDQVEYLVNNKYRIQNMNFDRLEGPVKKLTLKP
jgi:penicillin G amidase